MKEFSIKTYVKVKHIFGGKRGDFVQQGLLWTLIAIAGITALTAMGGAITDKFDTLKQTFLDTDPDDVEGTT
ncbi:Flp family type IVb pilin [Chengkuizengella axinellae]|uniref:Flagellin Flp1-like domain-containing protein n=1 Tax=Chengkuizengella axinellae TaxID=3064388 RepID=A0ABT9J3I6_9BACL|nr:hypothetical protein [Chengkuizengella sp. 2205SS18-9]MDP5276123.1 hypothetical protein [Chengkuizengella sp. 2205SS18-9]